MLTVTLPPRYCARDVTIIARSHNDGTASLEAFDAGGALWPVAWDGLMTPTLPEPLAEAFAGDRVFATPEVRP